MLSVHHSSQQKYPGSKRTHFSSVPVWISSKRGFTICKIFPEVKQKNPIFQLKRKSSGCSCCWEKEVSQIFCQDSSKFVRHHHILIKWSHCSSSLGLEYSISAHGRIFWSAYGHEDLRDKIPLTSNKTVSLEPGTCTNYSEISSVWNNSMQIALLWLSVYMLLSHSDQLRQSWWLLFHQEPNHLTFTSEFRPCMLAVSG